MTKFGSGTRATFISPYLRRPLRPLNKVLSERDEADDSEARKDAANDESLKAGSPGWRRTRKSFVASE